MVRYTYSMLFLDIELELNASRSCGRDTELM